MVTKFTGVPFYYVGESYWDLCPAGIWQGEKKKKKKKERHCYIS